MSNIGFENHKKGKKTYSSSRWETSYYGGYYNMIIDHPEIQLNYKLDLDIKTSMGLPWYTGDKLAKIFLLKCKDLNMMDPLTRTAKVEEKTKFWNTKKVLSVDKKTLEAVFNSVCERSPEYKNLFEHYKELLTGMDISVPLPPDPKKPQIGGSGSKSKEEGKEEGKGKGKGKGKEEEGSEAETEAAQGKGKGKSKGKSKEEEESEDSEENSEENSEDSEDTDDGEGEQEDEKSWERGTRELKYHEGEESISKARQELKDYLGEIKKREVFSSYLNGNILKDTAWVHHTDRPKCKFTDEEYMYASRLVKLLDINFDPAVDRINSLRTGKLDPRKLAEVIPGNTNVYYLNEENQTTKPFSVVILQDESGSMSEYNKLEHSKRILKTLYLAFSEILPENKLYVYGHSGYGNPKIFIYQDKYNPKFEERIEWLDSHDYNYDGPAIEAIYDKVRNMTDDNIIFITLSDGQPCGRGYGGEQAGAAMKRVLEKCRRDGFVTVGLGIKHFNDPTLYNYSCVLQNLGDDMIKKTSHIINKVVKTEFQ